MADRLLTLGTFSFWSTSFVVNPPDRTIGIASNALAPEPTQTVDYYSGYRKLDIGGYLRGIDTQGETAADCLLRLWNNLEAEVAKATNTLVVRFRGASTSVTYYIVKNDAGPSVTVPIEAQFSHLLPFTVSLNARP